MGDCSVCDKGLKPGDTVSIVGIQHCDLCQLYFREHRQTVRYIGVSADDARVYHVFEAVDNETCPACGQSRPVVWSVCNNFLPAALFAANEAYHEQD